MLRHWPQTKEIHILDEPNDQKSILSTTIKYIKSSMTEIIKAFIFIKTG